MIELLLVDDSRFFRQRLRQMLADEPEIAVSGEAATAGEAFAMVEQRRYHLVLLDVSLPDHSGFHVLKQLKQNHPTLPVLMVSGHCEPQFSVEASDLGAAGYVTKDRICDELVSAIHAGALPTGTC